MHTNTFAGRMGRWSAQHRKKAIWGWIAFVVIAFAVGNAAGTKQPTHDDYVGQSGQAEKLFADHFAEKDGEQVMVQAPKGGKATDAAVRAAVAQTIAAVSGKPGVTNVQSPYQKGNEAQVSKDGRSVLVEFDLKGDTAKTDELVKPTITAVDKVKDANPKVFVGQFGGASVNKALADQDAKDSSKALSLSLPATLLILLITFGALVAAGVPLLLGLTAVIGTLGLVAGVSHIVPMDSTVTEVVLLVGLAVGVDYSLFYLRREREERARGASKLEAIEVAAASSGRAVLIAGLHRHGGDGRHVLRRPEHLHRAGHRRDHGRRRRDDRLGHRAPRRAVVAGRSRREGPRALPASPAPRRGRGSRLGLDPGQGAQAPRGLRRAWPPACSSR